MMNPVDWFEIPVTDITRANRFYEDVFGLQISLNKVGQLEMGWFPMENNSLVNTEYREKRVLFHDLHPLIPF